MNKSNCSSRQDAKTPSFFFKKIFAAWRLCASFCLLTLTVSGAEVKFPQEAAVWTVRVEPTRSQKNAAPVLGLARMEVAQDEIKRRYTLRFTSGSAREVWELHNFERAVAVADQSSGTPAVALNAQFFGVQYDRSSFGWLAGAARRDEPAEPFAKRNCVYYTGWRPVRDADGQVVKNLPCAAWLDTETGWPLALDDGENFVTYEYNARAIPPLTMPEKLKVKLTRTLLQLGLDPVEDL